MSNYNEDGQLKSRCVDCKNFREPSTFMGGGFCEKFKFNIKLCDEYQENFCDYFTGNCDVNVSFIYEDVKLIGGEDSDDAYSLSYLMNKLNILQHLLSGKKTIQGDCNLVKTPSLDYDIIALTNKCDELKYRIKKLIDKDYE